MSRGEDGVPRAPSIVEVAERAGVSRQTVSRVLNNASGVLPETRDRVRQAISELGYRRNWAATTLVTQRSGLIGVITIGSFLHGPTSTLAAIEQAARERGYMILLNTLSPDALDNEVGPALHATLERRVEAVVVIASREAMVRRFLSQPLDVPALLVGPSPTRAGRIRSLSVDQKGGARLAVDHLIDLGHRRLALLAGPVEWVDAQDRLTAALERCAAHGITPRVLYGDWRAQSGYDAAARLMSQRPRPTAVFAANDAMALGLLGALHEQGVDVPRRLSVVGFDDVGGSAFYTPPLTTVRQDFSTLGNKVMGALDTMVRGGKPDLRPVKAELVVRSSTAPAPRTGAVGQPERSLRTSQWS